MSGATQDTKSYTERVTDAAVGMVVAALSGAAPESDSVESCARFDDEIDEPDAVVSLKLPATISAPEPVAPSQQAVEPGAVLISGEIANLLRASIRAGLSDVTVRVLRVVLEG